jgi:hypothetical protein
MPSTPHTQGGLASDQPHTTVERESPLVIEPTSRQAPIQPGGRSIEPSTIARGHVELSRHRRGVARTMSYRHVWS